MIDDRPKPLFVAMIVIVLLVLLLLFVAMIVLLLIIVAMIVIVLLVCFSALCSAASVSPFQSEGASKEQSLLVN